MPGLKTIMSLPFQGHTMQEEQSIEGEDEEEEEEDEESSCSDVEMEDVEMLEESEGADATTQAAAAPEHEIDSQQPASEEVSPTHAKTEQSDGGIGDVVQGASAQEKGDEEHEEENDEEVGEEDMQQKEQEVAQCDSTDEGNVEDEKKESKELLQEPVAGTFFGVKKQENWSEQDTEEPQQSHEEQDEDHAEPEKESRGHETSTHLEGEQDPDPEQDSSDDDCAMEEVAEDETNVQSAPQQPEGQPDARPADAAPRTEDVRAVSYLRHTVRPGDEVVIVDPSTGLLGQIAFVHCVLGPKQLECILRGGESRLLGRGQVTLRCSMQEQDLVTSKKERILLRGLNGGREETAAVKLANDSLAAEAQKGWQACLPTARSAAERKSVAPAQVNKDSRPARINKDSRARKSNPLPFEQRSMCMTGARVQERTSFDLMDEILDKHIGSEQKDNAADGAQNAFGTPDPKIASKAAASTPVQRVSATKRKAPARQLKSPALRKLAQAVDAEVSMSAPRYAGQGITSSNKRRRL